MPYEQPNLNVRLPLEKLVGDYVTALSHSNPEAVVVKESDEIFVKKEAVSALVRGLFLTTRRRGVCFLN